MILPSLTRTLAGRVPKGKTTLPAWISRSGPPPVPGLPERIEARPAEAGQLRQLGLGHGAAVQAAAQEAGQGAGGGWLLEDPARPVPPDVPAQPGGRGR